jgi:ElaB/YqjD/DUF883 family membrane-anchored ribosome-binding protein
MEKTGKVTPNPHDGGRHLGRAVDQAGLVAHDAINKVSDAAQPAVNSIASGAHQAVNRITVAAGEAAEALGVKGEQLQNAQAHAMKQIRNYVRANPAKSLGIAVAAGYFLSQLLRSR